MPLHKGQRTRCGAGFIAHLACFRLCRGVAGCPTMKASYKTVMLEADMLRWFGMGTGTFIAALSSAYKALQDASCLHWGRSVHAVCVCCIHRVSLPYRAGKLQQQCMSTVGSTSQGTIQYQIVPESANMGASLPDVCVDLQGRGMHPCCMCPATKHMIVQQYTCLLSWH